MRQVNGDDDDLHRSGEGQGDRQAIALGVRWARECLALDLSDEMQRIVAEATRSMTLLLAGQRSLSSDSR